MAKKRMFVETSESEEYLHRDAWVVVNRQIAYAEQNKTGCLYDYLVAMLFAFHCIEGYLNFVGDKIAPELWADEKKEFGRTGLYGKLNAICGLCKMAPFAKGRRPYSTISELGRLRNRMAHPKTHKQTTTTFFPEGKGRPLFRKTYLATVVSREKALRARDDVRSIADQVHDAVLACFPERRSELGHEALDWILSVHSGSVALASGHT